MQLGAALISILDGLIVKGVVMLLSAWLLVKLWLSLRPRPAVPAWLSLSPADARELRVLVASLVVFATSELACTVDMLLLGESRLMDGLHSITSALGTGLFALWLVRYVDRKIVRFGEAGCVINRVCKGCTFAHAERCKVLNVALLVAAFVACLAILPLFVSTAPIAVDPNRYALPFESLNAWYDAVIVPWQRARMPRFDPGDYQMPASTLVLEMRVIPLAAGALAVASLALMKGRRESLGLRVLGFAAGMLAYCYLEVALFAATRDPIIGSLGHELAELWFLVVTIETLRRGFGRGSVAQAAA